MLFWIIISFVILQRFTELIIAKRNAKWLISQGAIEYGKEHYKFIVLLHVFFFISMITEYWLGGRYSDLNFINYSFLVIFVLMQFFRVWVISSLGKYWNTRIFRIPGRQLVAKGPYKIFKHPNYIVVIGEILVLPLVFNLFYTAIIFTILNALMLTVRIRTENKALEY
ncbi:MAG TPA: isoprenylcysteine carboxylmethyltransferase family protein [Ignavibacteria bacterium]|nr:isoprenylcysteine carboxylmethyltransferase family protein [Ignavibacteria bacterium]